MLCQIPNLLIAVYIGAPLGLFLILTFTTKYNLRHHLVIDLIHWLEYGVVDVAVVAATALGRGHGSSY